MAQRQNWIVKEPEPIQESLSRISQKNAYSNDKKQREIWRIRSWRISFPLALDTPAQMREKSDNLDTGYAPSENTWELIVKYNGNLDRLTGGIRVEPLIAGYAIVTIPENLIGAFSRMEEIEFIEKPKKLYPQVTAGLGASCFYPLLQPVSGKALAGQGVYMAILDSGIDYTDPMFRYADGTTKIAWLWDQGKRADAEKGEKPPQGFFTGVEYSRKMLNANLQKNSERLTTDVTGHGQM